MPVSPTQRTLRECRERGWLACVVEKWGGNVRIDAFGFGDILVLDGQSGSLLIQATSIDNISSRVKKIQKECGTTAAAWVAAGNRIEVWGWGQRGGRGQRKIWTLRIVEVQSGFNARIVPLQLRKKRSA